MKLFLFQRNLFTAVRNMEICHTLNNAFSTGIYHCFSSNINEVIRTFQTLYLFIYLFFYEKLITLKPLI